MPLPSTMRSPLAARPPVDALRDDLTDTNTNVLEPLTEMLLQYTPKQRDAIADAFYFGKRHMPALWPGRDMEVNRKVLEMLAPEISRTKFQAAPQRVYTMGMLGHGDNATLLYNPDYYTEKPSRLGYIGSQIAHELTHKHQKGRGLRVPVPPGLPVRKTASSIDLSREIPAQMEKAIANAVAAEQVYPGIQKSPFGSTGRFQSTNYYTPSQEWMARQATKHGYRAGKNWFQQKFNEDPITQQWLKQVLRNALPVPKGTGQAMQTNLPEYDAQAVPPTVRAMLESLRGPS